MIQQINLYQNVLKKNKSQTAINPLHGLLALGILLIGCSIYLLFNMNATKNSLHQARQQLLETETQIADLKVKYPEAKTNPLLTQEINRSQGMLSSLSQIVHLLTNKQSDQTQGFSRYFLALSRQNISEVWLSNIAINGKESSLTLQGSTYNAEKIPLLLQKLQHESIFQGKNFAKLVISQAEESTGKINFTVSSTDETLEQAHHD